MDNGREMSRNKFVSVTKIRNRIKYKIDSSVMSTISTNHILTFRWTRAHACYVYHAQYNVSLVESIRAKKLDWFREFWRNEQDKMTETFESIGLAPWIVRQTTKLGKID